MTADEVRQQVGQNIAQSKFDVALDILHAYLREHPDEKQIAALLEQVLTIVKYHNRDIYAATNLDMDPWEE